MKKGSGKFESVYEREANQFASNLMLLSPKLLTSPHKSFDGSSQNRSMITLLGLWSKKNKLDILYTWKKFVIDTVHRVSPSHSVLSYSD